jgi:hypothetical protein
MSPSLPADQRHNPSAPPEAGERDIYRRTFLRTVLRLHGIAGTPTDLQLAKSRKILKLYEIKAALANILEPDAAGYRVTWSAGVEQAFLFVRFNSVAPPDAQQVQALNDWLSSDGLRQTATH